MSENGKLAWVFEKEFKEKIGEKGQRILRVVVDKEGRVVTAFPVDNLLKRVAIRGIQVSAQIAAAALLATLYENEAQAADLDTATRYKSAEDEKSWFETALEWAGPFGLLESIPVGLGPNFSKIQDRSAAVISEAENELGRGLTSEEAGVIRQDIYSIWADSATSFQR